MRPLCHFRFPSHTIMIIIKYEDLKNKGKKMEDLANKNLSIPVNMALLPTVGILVSSVADAVGSSYVFSVAHWWPTGAWWHIQCPTCEPPSKRTMAHRCDRNDPPLRQQWSSDDMLSGIHTVICLFPVMSCNLLSYQVRTR